VTETGNPKNRLGVSQVEIFHPAPILRHGVVLIDTPGIGSTLRHNTEATLNFLPQCDAAVFLVSADPPLTEVEVEFLTHVRSRVARLFFVMNKVDYLAAEERQEAVHYLRRVLVEHVGIAADVPIFCVSARVGLQARQANDAASWTSSGLDRVQAHLIEFLAREKSAALRVAVTRKAVDLLEDALLRLRLAIRSLRLPLDELQARLAKFEQTIQQIETERLAADDLVRGEQRRMHAFLEDQAEALRGKARTSLQSTVTQGLEHLGDRGLFDESAVRDRLAEEIPGFFERQMGDTTALFREKVASGLRPHQERADRLIGSVREAAATLFDIPFRAPVSDDAYELIREPYWVTRSWTSSLNPIPRGLADRLLPARMRRMKVERNLMNQVETLVIRNVENLRWETFQSLNKTFHRFRTTLDERLADTIAATHGAIRTAIARRDRHTGNIADEVSRLEAAVSELGEIKDRIVSAHS
jgi:SpoVK/Ycf46/Vps4 family AAA+-type ATPase